MAPFTKILEYQRQMNGWVWHIGRKKPTALTRKICSSVTLFTINCTWPGLELNPGLHSGRSVNDYFQAITQPHICVLEHLRLGKGLKNKMRLSILQYVSKNGLPWHSKMEEMNIPLLLAILYSSPFTFTVWLFRSSHINSTHPIYPNFTISLYLHQSHKAYLYQ
jgi:hypothetical protein